jgi:tetratricopeptide (TPR) repeat protein
MNLCAVVAHPLFNGGSGDTRVMQEGDGGSPEAVEAESAFGGLPNREKSGWEEHDSAFPGADFLQRGLPGQAVQPEVAVMRALQIPLEKSASMLRRVILTLAAGCLLLFLCCGIVGVVRGYSVQSWVPIWVGLLGVFLLIPFQSKQKWTSLLSSLFLIVFSLVGIAQGNHHKQGEELYEDGKYEEAMEEFQKEIDTWYLRLKYNYHEDASLFRIAQSQSQLERFEEARETYREVEQKFRGYYQDRARKARQTLADELSQIRELNEGLGEATDDEEKATLCFDLALAYRALPCVKKAIEHYEMIQELEVRETRKEQARRFAEDLR